MPKISLGQQELSVNTNFGYGVGWKVPTLRERMEGPSVLVPTGWLSVPFQRLTARHQQSSSAAVHAAWRPGLHRPPWKAPLSNDPSLHPTDRSLCFSCFQRSAIQCFALLLFNSETFPSVDFRKLPLPNTRCKLKKNPTGQSNREAYCSFNRAPLSGQEFWSQPLGTQVRGFAFIHKNCSENLRQLSPTQTLPRGSKRAVYANLGVCQKGRQGDSVQIVTFKCTTVPAQLGQFLPTGSFCVVAIIIW